MEHFVKTALLQAASIVQRVDVNLLIRSDLESKMQMECYRNI